uniref:CBM21 domain-containing protein n=1 Tax=Erpetoichthys calabaricus TaxID=27687 RepID=A0A8C4RIJ7_ERPCA
IRERECLEAAKSIIRPVSLYNAEVPSVIARKVSFADAFGLDLVSVKEFDTWDVPISSFSEHCEEDVPTIEEYFFSSAFTVPSTKEELMHNVHTQKVALESIEFIPGVTSMKGIIRVLNVCFEKLVYVRMTLDAWSSYYDILAEYIPGSSDGETDQFSFKILLVPPYQKEGAKIEFCIRYETSLGTFWSNNKGLNYTLLCHKKSILDTRTQSFGMLQLDILVCKSFWPFKRLPLWSFVKVSGKYLISFF